LDSWFEASYPGCGVDTPSRFYSYFFFESSRWHQLRELSNDEAWDGEKTFG